MLEQVRASFTRQRSMKRIWEFGVQVCCWVFLKLVFLSDQPAAKERTTTTLTDNCLRQHCCGKTVCPIPSSGTTVGSLRSCAGVEVNVQPRTTSQSICSRPCFRQVTPHSSPVLAAGPLWVFSGWRFCNGTVHLQPTCKLFKTKNTHGNHESAVVAWKSCIWLPHNTVLALTSA